MTATTPLINAPRRTEEEFRAGVPREECAEALAQKDALLGSIWAQQKPYVDLRARRAEHLRRRLYRHAFCLWRELDRRELDGAVLSEEERGQLVTTLTAIRRALV